MVCVNNLKTINRKPSVWSSKEEAGPPEVKQLTPN